MTLQVVLKVYVVGMMMFFFLEILIEVDTPKEEREFSLNPLTLLLIAVFSLMWPIWFAHWVRIQCDQLHMMIYLARIAPTRTQRR